MSKIAVIYWSGTGNTQAMAEAVAAGAKEAGAEADLLTCGKKVALFGSYGWGDGEWMRSWEARCAEKGIALAAESVMANEAPDDAATASCKALGKALA